MARTALLLVLLVLPSAIWAGTAQPDGLADPFADVARAYLLRVDGRDLWGHDPEARLAPASLTKMMTALLALERARLAEPVKVSGAAAGESGTRLGLTAGCQMTVGELLAATLMQSANDACHALAEHVGGSEAAFVRLMNERAATLALRGTRFANACGHDDPGLFATARDLARLAETAMANPVFARLVGLSEGEIFTADRRQRFSLTSTNALLGRLPGAKGIKTGFTPQAGKCLVAWAERQGKTVLLVLLDAPDRWWTADRMVEAAFRQEAGLAVGQAP